MKETALIRILTGGRMAQRAIDFKSRGERMHGEFKTPGGKLVVVDFDVVDNKLSTVQVSGDFFLYPEEALAPITNAIVGLPPDIRREDIAAAVAGAIQPGATLVGFSPEAIAIAIERGLHDERE